MAQSSHLKKRFFWNTSGQESIHSSPVVSKEESFSELAYLEDNLFLNPKNAVSDQACIPFSSYQPMCLIHEYDFDPSDSQFYERSCEMLEKESCQISIKPPVQKKWKQKVWSGVKSAFFLPLVCLSLSGCSRMFVITEKPKGAKYLTKNPLFLPVQEIEFIPSLNTPKNAYIEIISLPKMVEQWAIDYLQAQCSGHQKLTIYLEKADVWEQEKKHNPKAIPLIYSGCQEKFMADIQLRCVLDTQDGKKEMTLSVSGSKDVPKCLSLTQRRDFLTRFFEELINILTRKVNEKLPSWTKDPVCAILIEDQ